MQGRLYDIAERFSYNLDQTLGAERRGPVRQLRAWAAQSVGRRSTLRWIGGGLAIGAACLLLYRNRRLLRDAGSNIIAMRGRAFKDIQSRITERAAS